MVDLVNAAPMVIDQGTDDLSTREVPESPLQIPQHLPKFYIFGEKGPTEPTYVDLSSVTLTKLYGSRTFDVADKFYTHSTKFLEKVAAAGNNCVVQRMVTGSQAGLACVTLSLDVLPIVVPVYAKGPGGAVLMSGSNPVPLLDGLGAPITTPGYNVFWVATVGDGTTFGQAVPGPGASAVGTQTGGTGGVASTRYPIFKFTTSSPGSYGNTVGIRFYAAHRSDSLPFSASMLDTVSNFTYFFEMIKYDPKNGYKVIGIKNKYQANASRFVLKAGQRDPKSNAVSDITKVLTDAYITSPFTYNTNDLGNVLVNTANLDTVLELFYQAERGYVEPLAVNRDPVVSRSGSNHYCMNIASFCSSNGSPYQAIKNIVGGIKLDRRTNIFMGGSNDGTLAASADNANANAALETGVRLDLANYNDISSSYMDLVMNPEAIVWDTGYSLLTKKAIMQFIALRKDTFIALSTYAHDNPALTLAEHQSIGIDLRTAIELYPESSTFGTPVMRGMVISGSGLLINDTYTSRVPVSIELAIKAAAYMGASNGKWKSGLCFDHAPGSVIRNINNIDVTWVPAAIRNDLWDIGVNFVLNYSKRNQFFPAVKTVYNDDTSVLNSFFTAIAISFLNKVAHSAWREFSGAISFTNAQLEERVNTFVANTVKDRFDNKFVVIPACTVTELDNLQGFSWTLPIKIYANNMKTVMTTYVEAHRMSDLSA